MFGVVFLEPLSEGEEFEEDLFFESGCGFEFVMGEEGSEVEDDELVVGDTEIPVDDGV